MQGSYRVVQGRTKEASGGQDRAGEARGGGEGRGGMGGRGGKSAGDRARQSRRNQGREVNGRAGQERRDQSSTLQGMTEMSGAIHGRVE